MSSTVGNARLAEILHVEDDDGVAELTRELFRRSKQDVRVHRARDGEDCMAFLRKEGSYGEVPTPDIILLDLNMPRMDGREVMEEILKDEKLKHMPVVVLTTSQDEHEIFKMYQLRCNSYIVKPIRVTDYIKALETFCSYWFSVVSLPAPH